MKKAIILCAIALAGCETAPPRPMSDVMYLQNFDLCYGLIAGHRDFPQAVISMEINRRGEDCKDQLPLVQAKIQANQARRAEANAQTAQGIQLLNAARPQDAQPMAPLSTQCETRYNFGVARTTCR